MKNISTLFISIVFISFCSFGQIKNPGFLGKRFTFDANAGLAVNLNGIFSKKQNHPEKQSLAFKSTFEFEAAVSKNFGLGLQFGIMTAKTGVSEIYEYSDGDSYSYVFYESEDEFIKTNYSNIEIALKLKSYRDGFFAPVGKSIYYSFGVIFSNPNEKTINFSTTPDYGSTFVDRSVTLEKYIFFKFGIGLDFKRMIYKSLYFKSNVELNYTFFKGYLIPGVEFNAVESPYEWENDLPNNLYKNTFFNNLFSLTAGIGVAI